MTKALTVATAIAALVAATALTPGDAHAGPRGGAVAAGIIGGIAAGALLGGAIANSRGYYGYAPVAGYAPYPAYVAPYPVGCPGGYWARRPLYDGYGEFVGYSRPRFFCP